MCTGPQTPNADEIRKWEGYMKNPESYQGGDKQMRKDLYQNFLNMPEITGYDPTRGEHGWVGGQGLGPTNRAVAAEDAFSRLGLMLPEQEQAPPEQPPAPNEPPPDHLPFFPDNPTAPEQPNVSVPTPTGPLQQSQQQPPPMSPLPPPNMQSQPQFSAFTPNPIQPQKMPMLPFTHPQTIQPQVPVRYGGRLLATGGMSGQQPQQDSWMQQLKPQQAIPPLAASARLGMLAPMTQRATLASGNAEPMAANYMRRGGVAGMGRPSVRSLLRLGRR